MGEGNGGTESGGWIHVGRRTEAFVIGGIRGPYALQVCQKCAEEGLPPGHMICIAQIWRNICNERSRRVVVYEVPGEIG